MMTIFIYLLYIYYYYFFFGGGDYASNDWKSILILKSPFYGFVLSNMFSWELMT